MSEQLDIPMSRSAAILEAAGYEIVPLRYPLAGVWHLLAADPFHMLLVSVVRGPRGRTLAARILTGTRPPGPRGPAG